MGLTKALPASRIERARRGPSLRWDRLIILLALFAFWGLFIDVILRYVLG